MKRKFSLSKFLRNLIGVIVLLCVSMSCLCSGDSENEKNENVSRKTPRSSQNTDGDKNSSTTSEPIKAGSYRDNLPADFRTPDDSVGKRILTEYGAVYVAKGGVTPPPTVMFNNESECSSWQSQVSTSRSSIGGTSLELQTPAMKALQSAISEAQSAGTTITPRGADSARRSYSDTVELWASRVNPALTHWVGKGRVTQADASRIKSLSPTQQVPEVLRLEDQGIYFSKDFSKSILYSVAAPGTSQHLSMLAFDINEHENAQIRSILAKHGWYQTVVSDLPHFTYLGVSESDLPKLGLKKKSTGGRAFWIPSL